MVHAALSDPGGARAAGAPVMVHAALSDPALLAELGRCPASRRICSVSRSAATARRARVLPNGGGFLYRRFLPNHFCFHSLPKEGRDRAALAAIVSRKPARALRAWC